MTTRISLVVLVATITFAGTSSQAAMLTGSVNTTIDGNQDLSALGNLDWAIWDYPGIPAPGSPSNRKSGGSEISDVSPVGGGTTRSMNPITLPGTFDFSYSDGTSPGSQSNFVPRGTGNTLLDSVGAGVSFTVDGGEFARKVQVYVSGFNGSGTMTASLNGATSYVDSSGVYAGAKSAVLYEFEFLPDNASDQLTVQYTLATDTGSSAHVLIAAVAVEGAIVPEPSSFALAGLGLIGFARLRRRRSRR